MRSPTNAADAKILRISQLYVALSHCNKAIVQCDSEEELFMQVCRAAVQFGGMKMAWIGITDTETLMVWPAASFGEGIEYLQDIEISVDADSPFGHGPTGTAIRENRPFWCQDFLNDPITTPWHERGAHFDWRSSASIPLQRNGAAIGAFTLYADEVNAFDEATSDLLVEMATNISFALDNFVRKSERKQAEQKAKELTLRYQTLMQTSIDGIHVMDKQGNIVEANNAFCHMLGYTQEEMARLNLADWDAQWSVAKLRTMFKASTGSNAVIETVHRRKDGALINVEISISNAELDGRNYFFASSRDITERKQVEESLKNMAMKYHTVFELSTDAIMLLNEKGFFDCNEATLRMFGCPTRDDFISKHPAQLSPPTQPGGEDSMSLANQRIATAIKNGSLLFEWMHRRLDGADFPAEVLLTAMELDGKAVLQAVVRDITERKQAVQELHIAAATFEVQEGIIVTDAHNVILRVNQSFTRLTGYSAEEAIGQTPALLKSGRHDSEFYRQMWEALTRDHYWQGEIWNRRKNGEVYPEWLNISAIINAEGQVTNYIASFSDITQHKAAEDEIKHLAFYDPLTDLPNRRLLHDRLRHAFAAGARHHNHGALLFIDLDNFKTLNDTKGHNVGDLLLIEVANRLQACVRKGDTSARLGGDEFVVVLEKLNEDIQQAAAQTEVVGKKILTAISQPYALKDYEYHSSASIGISLFRNHVVTVDELLKRADTAMYQAKNAGRNTLRFYDPAVQVALEARTALENDLRRALAENQFRLYYQMQVEHTSHIIGAEVLIRWQHPQRGLVSPLQFIPLAEETNLILLIGQWVLETACAQLKAWEADPLTRDLQLAVNVSARQFHQPDFVKQVRQTLRSHALKPDRLKLELTESMVLDNIDDTIVKMQALRKIGVRFSMDDFGTGYSSLAYLTQLPLDQLKIDQSFVHNIGVKHSDAVIVQTIIGMANNLGMEVIAEGVETEDQRAFLEQHGCALCQGYLFGRPVPVGEFEARLKSS
jgi:diguanylate cyclase (GGDEF)-like protein/PAS domain S-box-containing protein